MGFPDAELSITLTSDSEIAEIAGRFGRLAEPTDVLAFPTREGLGARFRRSCLGDVLISIERADAQALQRRVSLARELEDLMLHGVLHLLGMDHARAAEARAMRELEAHLRWELARSR